jgi:signal transduction histidine kinase
LGQRGRTEGCNGPTAAAGRLEGGDRIWTEHEMQIERARRKTVESALKKSGEHYKKLLQEPVALQKHLHHLTRRMLSAQEDKRKKISRELHDVTAQTLTSINIRLASLKKQAALNTQGLERSIGRTQQLVE